MGGAASFTRSTEKKIQNNKNNNVSTYNLCLKTNACTNTYKYT